VERDQTEVDKERATADPADFGRSVHFTHRQAELNRRQARGDARQEQIENTQAGGDQRQDLLDEQQDAAASPNPPSTESELRDEMSARTQAAASRAVNARRRAHEAQRRADAAEARAEALRNRVRG